MDTRIIRGRIRTILFWRWILRKCGKRVSIMENQMIVGAGCISIAHGCVIFPRCRIEAVRRYGDRRFDPSLHIGDRSQIHQNAHITFAGELRIGEGTILTSNVTISDIVHPHQEGLTDPNAVGILVSPVRIGSRVYIYNNSVILPGVTIGDGAVVAANSVVTESVPPNCLAGGVPARILKTY